VVLGRQLDAIGNGAIAEAFVGYQASRLERTSRIQLGSRGNQWLKAGGNADWVYGYDAWRVPL
jgi:salicylate hydroxylase